MRPTLIGGLLLALAILPVTARADYLLAPSDAVRIKVRDWPDLAGDYTVGPDGRIAMPVIGDLKAQGISAAALGQAVAEAIKRNSGRTEATVAAVEIIRFRPFFVTGDVQRPGEHVFRPGLTVLQAVSMAGGYYRPASSNLIRSDREIALATGDIESKALRLMRSMIRAARLEASLAGKAEIDFPPEALERKGETPVAAALDGERAILAQERKRMVEETQSLENIRGLYNREIASLRGQGEALKREQDAIQKQLSELKGLAGRGLALTPNIITLERIIAQNQNEQLGVSTASVRAQQNIELAEQKMRDQNSERRRQHAVELQEARNEAVDARQRMTTAQEVLDEALVTERTEGRNPGTEIMQRRMVLLVRNEGGKTREFPADDATPLLPDDVLKVMPLPPRRIGNFRSGQTVQPPSRASQIIVSP
jgi:polysaccharide biosynthesis/export protein ExoF